MSYEKGKPIERWGRKVTGLKGKPHGSGIANISCGQRNSFFTSTYRVLGSPGIKPIIARRYEPRHTQVSILMKLSTFSVKNSCKLALVSVAVLGVLGTPGVFAAAVNDTATTSATVVTPIAIVDAQNLDFGEFAAGTGGTVVLTTGGAASPTGDVVLTSGTGAAAQFTVTGQADASFSIGVADDNLTHSDEVTTMALVTTHDLDGVSENNPASGTLTLGTQTLYVGGTLTVGNAQTVGVYLGTITATVNYN